MSLLDKGICIFCLSKPGLKTCSACHVTRYCSVECQRSHWSEHTKVCEKYNTHISVREDMNLLYRVNPNLLCILVADYFEQHNHKIKDFSGVRINILSEEIIKEHDNYDNYVNIIPLTKEMLNKSFDLLSKTAIRNKPSNNPIESFLAVVYYKEGFIVMDLGREAMDIAMGL